MPASLAGCLNNPLLLLFFEDTFDFLSARLFWPILIFKVILDTARVDKAISFYWINANKEMSTIKLKYVCKTNVIKNCKYTSCYV